MFVYQNAKREICVTFLSNKPVEKPEYVIAIDHENGQISINGNVMEVASTEAADEEPEAVSPAAEPDSVKEPAPAQEPEVPADDDAEAEEE